MTVCQPGKQYEIEACVATTATYGDRFRCICRYKYALTDASMMSCSSQSDALAELMQSVGDFVPACLDNSCRLLSVLQRSGHGMPGLMLQASAALLAMESIMFALVGPHRGCTAPQQIFGLIPSDTIDDFRSRCFAIGFSDIQVSHHCKLTLAGAGLPFAMCQACMQVKCMMRHNGSLFFVLKSISCSQTWQDCHSKSWVHV